MKRKNFRDQLSSLEPLDLKAEGEIKGGFLSLDLHCSTLQETGGDVVINIFKCSVRGPEQK
jgi:hypothetical protein